MSRNLISTSDTPEKWESKSVSCLCIAARRTDLRYDVLYKACGPILKCIDHVLSVYQRVGLAFMLVDNILEDSMSAGGSLFDIPGTEKITVNIV